MLSEIRGAPFWCRNWFKPFTDEVIPDGSRCCWNHWIGLPVREGIRMPIYPFQEQWILEFFQYNYFWIEKPPKVGATELYLRLFLYQAVNDPAWKNGQVAIVVATSGMNEAEHMIFRCKELLKGIEGLSDNYNTRKEFFFDGCHFRAFPADNIDAARSQPNMRAWLIDEGAFFKQIDQSQVRSAGEHYIGSSKIKLVWVSTAGAVPEGAFYDIGLEPDVTAGGVYRKYIVDYHEGLKVHPDSGTTLYIPEELKLLEQSSTFARNFLHVWGAGSGNIFSMADLALCTRDHSFTPKDGRSLLNVDPAYGKKSKFAIVGMVKVEGHVYVTEAYQFDRPDPIDMYNHIALKAKNYSAVTYDGHWSGDIRALQKLGVRVNGVQYSDKLERMTDRSADIVKKHKVTIKPFHKELLEQLRGIVFNKKGVPDKDRAPFDMGDAFLQGINEFFDEGVGVAYQPPD